MNAEQLNAIKERVAKATPGPWRSAGLYGVRTQNDEALSIPLRPEDATFIASSREDVPALVTEVEQLRALLRQRDRQLEGERKGSQRVQAENDRLRAELQDIIAVATEEASCLSYESGYEDIVTIASLALETNL